VASINWTSGGSGRRQRDQTVTFTPDQFQRHGPFGYTISDGQATASALATITVNPVNDPPVANNDLTSTFRDTR